MTASSMSLKTCLRLRALPLPWSGGSPPRPYPEMVLQLVYRLSDSRCAQQPAWGYELQLESSSETMWYMDGHLVPVKVGIVGYRPADANEGLYHRSELAQRLNSQTVKGRCAVKEHWMFLWSLLPRISQIRSSPRSTKRLAAFTFAHSHGQQFPA